MTRSAQEFEPHLHGIIAAAPIGVNRVPRNARARRNLASIAINRLTERKEKEHVQYLCVCMYMWVCGGGEVAWVCIYVCYLYVCIFDIYMYVHP